MKALYVTDRAAIGDVRFEALLRSLRDAPGLSVELRERGSADRETLQRAESARESLGPAVPLLVNGRLDVARAAGASGVHLPADGLPFARVKAAAPRGFLVGVSTHSSKEAAGAIEAGADVVVIGPIFDTPSKRAFGPPLGTGALDALPLLEKHASDVYAIGGIGETELDRLAPFRDRIAGVAAVRLFQESAEPRAVVERIRAL
ncbi:MAG TPA: thiamine phosphate synthase [Thermoanaerobaculia bacterium]|nr:thiamine phosphate synthase [Thermoanaerobaculia bacterium]